MGCANPAVPAQIHLVRNWRWSHLCECEAQRSRELDPNNYQLEWCIYFVLQFLVFTWFWGLEHYEEGCSLSSRTSRCPHCFSKEMLITGCEPLTLPVGLANVCASYFWRFCCSSACAHECKDLVSLGEVTLIIITAEFLLLYFCIFFYLFFLWLKSWHIVFPFLSWSWEPFIFTQKCLYWVVI